MSVNSAEMMTNGSDVPLQVSSHSPTSGQGSVSPWKKPKQASDSDLAKQIMNSPQVKHSAYVPSQLERHLEFMHFNSGKIF